MSGQKSLVRDFMSPQLVHVRADHILEQAEKIFHDNQITAAPVIVDKKNVLGVLTDFQLIKFFLIRSTQPTRARVIDYQAELDPVAMVDHDATLETAFKVMIQSPSHRIYVTQNDMLVGALSPRDLLPFLAGDVAIMRYQEDRDLIAARVRIRGLMLELGRVKIERDRYHEAFTASPYMIHSADLDGKIIMANPMLHHVLGYEEGELAGKSIYDLYAQQFHNQAREGLTRVRADGYYPLINTLMVRKNQELIQVDIASSAKHDADGNVTATITAGRISDSAKMIEALKQAAEHYVHPADAAAGKPPNTGLAS
jgi:PAS domain S-box-containing protein